MAARRSADWSSPFLRVVICAIKSSALSPLALRWPICLLAALRCACSSSVRVWMALRSASSARKAASSRKGYFPGRQQKDSAGFVAIQLPAQIETARLFNVFQRAHESILRR